MSITDTPWNPDLGDGRYRNPILYADYSDPDIVRVGDDIYMVASSFNHMPALPILHSRDMVNWTIINHVFSHLDLPGYDQFQPGKGVWAPSIRYHAGTFWVFFSTPDEGIFMCQASDPRGQWSKPHCVKQAKGWIDPCPFWDDDGSAWLIHAFAFSRSGKKHLLQLCKMAPDGRALLDEGHLAVDGRFSLPTLEGPKLYKRNGWYYIFAPAGGVATGWQTALRARSLQGPWESRTLLQQGNTSVNGPHQGGWVALENGECWFVHFQDVYTYGRVVHLQPMRWEEDWPIIGEQPRSGAPGQPVMTYKKPDTGYRGPQQQPATSDDFSSPTLGLQWQWQATPAEEWMTLVAPGLRLFCHPMPLRDGGPSWYDVPNLLLQKFPAAEFQVTTQIHPHLLHAGERCGVIVYGERFAYLGVEDTEQGLALVQGYGWMSDAQQLEQTQWIITTLPHHDVLELRVTVRECALCEFAWRDAHGEFVTLADEFAAGPGKWVGAKVGLYALSLGSEQATLPMGWADITRFTVTALPR